MTPLELARRQKALIADLMSYAEEHMDYPQDKDHHPDDTSKHYHELDSQRSKIRLGELIKIKRGVCRHQCILEHLLLQAAGIDSRLASEAANTGSGNFRGLHIWVEV